MGPVRVQPPAPQGESCPYLDLKTKRCTVYERRPLICRLYGMTEELPCPFGCKPTPRYLTKAEAQYFAEESRKIGV